MSSLRALSRVASRFSPAAAVRAASTKVRSAPADLGLRPHPERRRLQPAEPRRVCVYGVSERRFLSVVFVPFGRGVAGCLATEAQWVPRKASRGAPRCPGDVAPVACEGALLLFVVRGYISVRKKQLLLSPRRILASRPAGQACGMHCGSGWAPASPVRANRALFKGERTALPQRASSVTLRYE